MNLKKLLSGAAALALAGVGVVALGASAQAAQIPDPGRIQGPMVVSVFSGPDAVSPLTWEFHAYQNGVLNLKPYDDGIKYAPPGQAPAWFTNLGNPAWQAAAQDADMGSFPEVGAGAGVIRFESGAAQGKCLSIGAQEWAVIVDCAGADTWTAKAKNNGIIFVSQAGYYFQFQQSQANVRNDRPFTDLFNPVLMSSAMRTLADLTAEVDRVEGNTGYISGTGEPGATITITGPDSTSYTTTVSEDGTWGPVPVPNLPEGDTALPVAQTVDGDAAGETSVTVTVPAAGEPLVALPDTAQVEQGKSVTIDVLANDTGKGPLVLEGVTEPEYGSVSIVDGELVFTADDNYQGMDSFTYTVKDADGNTAQATVTVAICAKAEGPLMAPAFALGGLALAGAGAGLKLRRRVARI